LREAQQQGLIRHVGISSHSHQILRRAIESGQFATVQLRYNAFNLRNEELIRLAHRKGIGVIVMKPLGGFGMAGALKVFGYWDRLNAKTLLRYVLSNRYVSVVIPGMRFPAEAEENVDVALTYKPMTPSERARLRELAGAYLAESAGPTAPAGEGSGGAPQ
jgi:predicted aldo/keto reductase-like oxidoreductase